MGVWGFGAGEKGVCLYATRGVRYMFAFFLAWEHGFAVHMHAHSTINGMALSKDSFMNMNALLSGVVIAWW